MTSNPLQPGRCIHSKENFQQKAPKSGLAWSMAHLSSSMLGTSVPLAARHRVPFISSPAAARSLRSFRVAAHGATESQEQRRRDVLLASSAQRLHCHYILLIQ